MNGFTILMFIFGFFVFLAGLYLYTGHKNELLLWRTHNVEKITKAELKVIGKWTMIASVFIALIGLLGFFIEV